MPDFAGMAAMTIALYASLLKSDQEARAQVASLQEPASRLTLRIDLVEQASLSNYSVKERDTQRACKMLPCWQVLHASPQHLGGLPPLQHPRRMSLPPALRRCRARRSGR